MTYSPPAYAAASTPLNQPRYGATLPVAFRRFFAKYATFSGRASRSEYWWVQLVFISISLALSIVQAVARAASPTTEVGMLGDNAAANGVYLLASGVGLVVALATFIPNLALLWRRLHDANLSAWFVLLILVPFVGPLIIFIMTLLASNPAGTRFDRA